MSEYREALQRGAQAMELPLHDALLTQMERHHQLVQRWASRINLTTLKDPVTAAHRHGLDCLLVNSMVPACRSVVDIGSGAGFPGIIITLCRPAVSVAMLEPTRKRASFLRVALAELALDASRAKVVEGRLLKASERLEPRTAALFPAEGIISRATLPPLELVARCAPRLQPGGFLISTAGEGAEEVSALVEAGAAANLVHEARLRAELPGGETRVLDRLRRPKA